MPSPFLYFVDERLSAAELSAACLDGHLVELGDAYIPADAVETSALRAGSLRGLLGDSLAATHVTAAWIHGGPPEPPVRHTVQRAVSRRLHHVFGVRIVYRELAVETGDLLALGGVWVTSPVRTLADLARIDDAEYERAARLLAASHPGLAPAAVEWLEASGPLPRKRPAIALLRGLPAFDGVEGVRRT